MKKPQKKKLPLKPYDLKTVFISIIHNTGYNESCDDWEKYLKIEKGVKNE